ncbi:hypothetical protein HAX54_031088 [Datura stramonium]|uniref:Uncharacterized protein n=1 Tax=Datura stramonium TaxID=4076 RepID=A0ABS8VC36_DATST|nr:hypothetical protein [Datura stramonium]
MQVTESVANGKVISQVEQWKAVQEIKGIKNVERGNKEKKKNLKGQKLTGALRKKKKQHEKDEKVEEKNTNHNRLTSKCGERVKMEAEIEEGEEVNKPKNSCESNLQIQAREDKEKEELHGEALIDPK